MRSAVFNSYGDPATVLKVEDSPVPNPGPGQVRIKTIMSAIHNHDLLTVSGNYAYKPTFPAIGGSEAVGTIDALGDGVDATVGQRVAVAGAHGTWAEYFLADAHTIVPVPEQIADETAAQLIGMPLSALFLLKFVDVKPGQWIVQNAATGAVAKVLAMAAQAKGINVINLVRREDGIADLADLGIRNGVATEQGDWRAKVKSIVGDNPIAAAVDGVAGSAAGELMSLLGEDGVLIAFGAMSGKPMQIASTDLIFKHAMAKGFWFTKIFKSSTPEQIGAVITELFGLIESNVVRLEVSAVFDLAKIAEASRANGVASRRGKVLLRL
jgi:NADPH:quinone reductase